MKFQLSNSTLKKLLGVTTVVNYIILVTYIFLLVSATSTSNYYVFLLSIPAYIISNSWLLIVAVFGFEILLLVYYWYKNKQTLPLSNNDIVNLPELTNEIAIDESTAIDFNIDLDESIVEAEEQDEQLVEIDDLFSQEREEELIAIDTLDTEKEQHYTGKTEEEMTQIELEFDKLWADAIEHVRLANGTDKKKAREFLPLVNIDLTLKEALSNQELQPKSLPKEPLQQQKLPAQAKNIERKQQKEKRKNKESLIHSLAPKKNPPNGKKHSIIRPEHREFYNEISLNNWIYVKKTDRDRIGKFKTAFDETPFREKDISYLIENGVIYKLLVPYPTGSFAIYSIYEGEDKKIISHYLADFCKKNRIPYSQKTISIVNYLELGLDKRIWRIDFQINKEILGLLWISNFLILDEATDTYSLTFRKKKELKALIAAAQLQFADKKSKALIITSYDEDKEVINDYISHLDYDKATVLAVGEEGFEKEFLEVVNEPIVI